MKKIITSQVIIDIINKFLNIENSEIKNGYEFFEKLGFKSGDEVNDTLGICIYEGILQTIDEFLKSNEHIQIDQNIILEYQNNKIKNMLDYIHNLDSNFMNALIYCIMNKIVNNELLSALYEVEIPVVKNEVDDEYERIIKIDAPKIIHEEELEKNGNMLTDEERTNLIVESEQLDKLDKYQGYISLDEASEEIRPGYTVYDYLEENNVLELIPLDASILLDDGYTMSGIDFIKQRVIPGAKFYNQRSVMDTIEKYSTIYKNKLELKSLKNNIVKNK